jgi:hypothetical protein
MRAKKQEMRNQKKESDMTHHHFQKEFHYGGVRKGRPPHGVASRGGQEILIW